MSDPWNPAMVKLAEVSNVYFGNSPPKYRTDFEKTWAHAQCRIGACTEPLQKRCHCKVARLCHLTSVKEALGSIYTSDCKALFFCFGQWQAMC